MHGSNSWAAAPELEDIAGPADLTNRFCLTYSFLRKFLGSVSPAALA
jgi:hypothetical protein